MDKALMDNIIEEVSSTAKTYAVAIPGGLCGWFMSHYDVLLGVTILLLTLALTAVNFYTAIQKARQACLEVNKAKESIKHKGARNVRKTKKSLGHS